MLDVAAAFSAVMETVREWAPEWAPLEAAAGRVLRAPVLADRAFPPYDRVTMDGIAINYESFAKGQTIFGVEDMQAAGMPRKQLGNIANCIEVMTGAILPELTDTVIPYEQLKVSEHDGFRRFTVNGPAQQGQNIHRRGTDAVEGQLLVPAGTLLGPAETGVLASVGVTRVAVSRLPRVAIIATGDELVPVEETPGDHQVRTSNSYSLAAALRTLGIGASLHHAPDNMHAIEQLLQSLLQADVWICTGAVSAGKYDYLPQALQQLGMRTVFHKVRQRPGKPFLFGLFNNGPVVFALPGNPVSGFMCCYRYVLPWLRASLQHPAAPPAYAVLEREVVFDKPLTYFLPVRLHYQPTGLFTATPAIYHGSGDLAALLGADGFMELPAEQDVFARGSSYPVWKFREV